jgi:hypothetical protein
MKFTAATQIKFSKIVGDELFVDPEYFMKASYAGT